MIKSLYIKNFALIDELEVSFGPGLNILTGETGAGKSIILGALQTVLGERADTETVREGARKAVVELILDIRQQDGRTLEELLKKNDIEHLDGQVILRREIRQGSSRSFVNDTPVPLSVLRAMGDRMVDLHGQHDHQMLLKQEFHREMIDRMPEVNPRFVAYQMCYDKLDRLRKDFSRLSKQQEELSRKKELHRFQLEELRTAALDLEEFEEMVLEMKRLDHAEELDRKASLIGEVGSESGTSLLHLLGIIEDALEDMVRMEPGFANYAEELKAAKISIQELLSFTERYKSRIEFNPDRLEKLRVKQAEFRRLEKKYARPLPDLIRYRDELEQSFQFAENFDLELGRMKDEIDSSIEELADSAKNLHEVRLAEGGKLAERVAGELLRLGIQHSRFETRVAWRSDAQSWLNIEGQKVNCLSDGPDEIAFYISTNKGESPRPLSRIASGGEVSRVMLAMKSVMARDQALPVMVFDEIDVGVSGAVAERVGKTMHDLSRYCQIIAITHQVQIAGQADHHYRVEKHEISGRTGTRIRYLDEESHISEIASLMSGEDVSEHALASAREMVCKAKQRNRMGLPGEESQDKEEPGN